MNIKDYMDQLKIETRIKHRKKAEEVVEDKDKIEEMIDENKISDLKAYCATIFVTL